MVLNSGLDDFLGSSSKTPRSGGSFLGNWKKNKDEDHGEIMIWFPRTFMPRSIWAHPIFNVIETQESKLKVVPRLWGCHEAGIERMIKGEKVSSAHLQKWRNDNGQAEHTPDICPECILTDVVARLVDEGKIGFTDVVFEWVGDESTTQILAGGIYGHFRKKKGLTREQQVAMRKAGIRQDEAFKHDLRTNMKFFCVIADDANPDKGLLTAVESEGFGAKIKAAILAERKKVAAQNRFTDDMDPRMLKSPLRDQWDPSINPYPFIWSYDNTQDAQNKASVIAMRGTEMTDAIRELVMGDELPDVLSIEPALEPGNCYELRAELEAHCKVDLPWDEIFGPAEKAGLMKPPSESKEEVREEKPAGRTPEITTKQDVPATGAITIGPDHQTWKNKAYKPGPEFKGREVLVLPPNDASDADVSRVIALFKSVATAVGEHVLCEHCNGEMTTFDPSCPHCGAEYTDDGKLATRPCVNPLCAEQVDLVEQLDKESGNHICAKCGTIQRVDESGAWVEVKREEPKPVQSARRRRSS